MTGRTTDTDRDRLYAETLEAVPAFRFDEKVARVFPDMIRRSVPGYQTLLNMIGVFAGHYVTAGSRCYDLGCSLGGATLAMRAHITQPDCRIIAVDNAPAMIERCRMYLAADEATTPVDLVCADIRDVAVEDASLVVMNLTLQFIDPAGREALLQRIYNGLRPGGALVLSEKITFADAAEQQHCDELYAAFKKAQGYSELEISQKRTALENVLIPDTLPVHLERLQAVGFSRVHAWYRCLNFASLIAVK